MSNWGFPQDSTLQRTVGYDVKRHTQVQSYPGYQARPYAGTMPQCGAPSLPPPASSCIPPTFPSGPLDPLAVGRGCLLCNAPCPNKWNAFCCEDHRAKYFVTHPINCRQCCCMGQYIDRSSGMRYFRDEVCSYCCGVFSKFRLPERVTAQNIELYNRETSSLQGQEALRQLKRQVPPEFVCLGCRAVPSAPWSRFCSEDCRTRKSLELHHLCLHCFQRPRMPNSAACSEECVYCLTHELPGRVTLLNLKQLDEFREKLRKDMQLDANPRPDCFEFNNSAPIVDDSCESSECQSGTRIAFFHPVAPQSLPDTHAAAPSSSVSGRTSSGWSSVVPTAPNSASGAYSQQALWGEPLPQLHKDWIAGLAGGQSASSEPRSQVASKELARRFKAGPKGMMLHLGPFASPSMENGQKVCPVCGTMIPEELTWTDHVLTERQLPHTQFYCYICSAIVSGDKNLTLHVGTPPFNPSLITDVGLNAERYEDPP